MLALAYIAVKIYYIIIVYPNVQLRSVPYYLYTDVANNLATGDSAIPDIDSIDDTVFYASFFRVSLLLGLELSV